MPSAKDLKVSVDEYLTGEEKAQTKHELINGQVYAMAGASENHNRIAGNLHGELRQQLKGKNCEPFISDMKVYTDGDVYYPDVMVVCDKHKDDTAFLKNSPKVIVEVLSKSTRVLAHSVKQQKYLTISSLEHYVLVEQDYCEIAVLSREHGWIPRYFYLGDMLTLAAINCEIAVVEIYDRVINEEMNNYSEQ